MRNGTSKFKGEENICDYWVRIPRAARLTNSVTVPHKKLKIFLGRSGCEMLKILVLGSWLSACESLILFKGGLGHSLG